MNNNKTLLRGLRENSSIYPLEEDKKRFYDSLIASGMFFEYLPKLSGDYDKDKDLWLSYWK